jgi:hypothetical protein
MKQVNIIHVKRREKLERIWTLGDETEQQVAENREIAKGIRNSRPLRDKIMYNFYVCIGIELLKVTRNLTVCHFS